MKEKDDKILIEAAQKGDTQSLEKLLNKYKNLVRFRVKSYFISGVEKEDLIQEGMIGLFKAIQSYESSRGSFRSFAELCIERQLITALRSATRQKHIPFDHYVSLDQEDELEEEVKNILSQTFANAGAKNPLSSFLEGEELKRIWGCWQKKLSPLEASVVKLRLTGNSYQEIASRLGVSFKSVDNALQRAKSKLAQCRQIS